MRNATRVVAMVAAMVCVWSGVPGAALAAETRFAVTLGGGAVRLSQDLASQDPRPTAGLILGLSASPRWAMELRAHGARAETNASAGYEVNLVHGETNLTLFLTEGTRIIPFLTAGTGAMRVDKVDNIAVNGGLGLKSSESRRLKFRLDLRDIVFNREHDIEAFLGLAFVFGGDPKDTDRDGIPDKVDACPATPAGARVDASGCPIDSDGDSVYDGFDQCAATPRGALVDRSGCPRDSDGDGVLDGLDKCAATPPGARVDPKGCPSDSDGDEVYDGVDQCEGTSKGCVVDAAGCPTDSDGDGVCDGIDQCTGTPPTARVDKNGCPIVVTEKETEMLETGMIRLQNINFATGKADIQPDSYAALDEVGQLLTRWPELRIEIGGHTDAQGSDEMNRKLSEARAQAVLRYILGKFPALQPAQFTAAGYGESKPIADNASELGRARNRRVEFKVQNTDVLKRERERQKIVPR